MRTSLLVAAGILASLGTAHAGLQTNGIQSNGVLWANGIQSNGIQSNGIQSNGIQSNGIQSNGIQSNGIQSNGIVLANASVVGTQVQGSFIGSGAGYSCSHREDAYGAALPTSCSPCAATVGQVDSYCSTTYWDGACVQEASSMCKAVMTTGSTLVANMTDGSTRQMKVGTRTQGGWTWDGFQWVDNSDVWTQTVSWVLPHTPMQTGEKLAAGQFGNACVKTVCTADSYCCNNAWDSQCVSEASSMCIGKLNLPAKNTTNGDSVCGYDANTGSARQAMFVAGTWNMSQGYQGAGGKNPSTAGAFTLACRGVGAVAKCVDMGFKPWLNVQQDTYHQACVRMVRADYCGDGKPWTVDGTTINVADYFNTQRDTEVWHLEATWSPKGARYIWLARLANSPTMSGFGSYIASHPYCQYNPSTGWGYEVTDPYVSNWNASHSLDANINMMRTEHNQTCEGDNCPP